MKVPCIKFAPRTVIRFGSCAGLKSGSIYVIKGFKMNCIGN